MMDGGKKKRVREEKLRAERGSLLVPVQMLVVLICSISTITSPASRLIINVISVIFTYTKDPGMSQCGSKEQKKRDAFFYPPASKQRCN